MDSDKFLNEVASVVAEKLQHNTKFLKAVAEVVASSQEVNDAAVRKIDPKQLADSIATKLFDYAWNGQFRATAHWDYIRSESSKLAAQLIAERAADNTSTTVFDMQDEVKNV